MMRSCILGALLFTIAIAAPLAPVFAQGPDALTLGDAAAFVEEGRYHEAIPLLRTLTGADPTSAPAAFLLGRAYLETDDMDAAEEWFSRAVQLEENSLHRMWLGRAYGLEAQQASILRKGRLAARMRENTIRAIELDPDNVDAHEDLMEFYLQAPRIAGGDKGKARQQADEILRLDGYRGHLAWGRVHEDAGNDAALVEWYQAAVRLNPGDRAPYTSLAYAQQRLGDYVGARDTFFALQRQDPSDLGVAYQLGRNAALSGQSLEEGERSLRRYLDAESHAEGSPSPAAAHWRLALVLEHQGRVDEAIEELERSRALAPDLEQAEEDLRRLRNARR